MDLLINTEIILELNKEISKKFPHVITVEVSNSCNLDCIMCKLREWDKYDPGLMKLDDFKTIIDKIESSDLLVDHLRLFWTGEPTLNPEFSKMIKYLQEKNVPRISFDTNGSNFNEDVKNEILNLSKKIPVHIIFSLDAFTEGTYNKVRKGKNLDKIVNNIINLLNEKDENLKVMIQFIVMEENKHEVKDFVEFWKSKFKDFSIFSNESFAVGDGVNLRLKIEYPDNTPQEKANLLFKNTIESINDPCLKGLGLREYKEEEENTFTCAHLFRNIMIRRNGFITLCPHDAMMELEAGNLLKHSLNEIMNSKKVMKFRVDNMFKDYKSVPDRCKSCVPDVCLRPQEEEEIKKILGLKKEETFQEQCANLNLVSYEENKVITEISPKNYYRGFFDKWSITFWEGDETIKEGYTHILGRDFGFIDYTFRNKIKEVKKGKIKLRISSHSKKIEKTEENASVINVKLNDVKIGSIKAYFNWPDCEISTIEFDGSKIIKGLNKLTFEIKKDDVYSNGLSIYETSISNKEKMGIIIELEK